MSHAMKATRDPGGRAGRLLLCALAFILIVINGVLAYAYLSEIGQTVAQANHSLQVARALKGIGDLAETSGQDQWLYRLYGDPKRLDSYRGTQSKLPMQL